MENKKTIIGMIIIIILIIVLIAVTILYNNFSETQLNLLTEESNKLIQQDLINEEIDEEIKTQKDYAIVEKTIKEYLGNIKNIYVEMEKLNSQINVDEIFSAQNVDEHKFNNVDPLINEYREKSKEYLEQCKNLIGEDKIKEAINSVQFSTPIPNRKEYYINLYNTVMLSDTMKSQLTKMEESVEGSKDSLYDKFSVLSKIKTHLEENSRYWNVKDDKIVFTNANIMVEYYDLINELNS